VTIAPAPSQPVEASDASRALAAPYRGAGERRGVLAVIEVAVIGAVLLCGLMIALGFGITGPLKTSVGHWDRDVANWFAHHRTHGVDTLTNAGTWFAETPVVVIGGAIAVALLAWKRCWHLFTVVAVGLLLEISVFMIVEASVARPRPPHGLEQRTTFSFPSGHVAAAIVLYGSIAVIAWTLTTNRAVRAVTLLFAVVVPFVVAASRVYRNMHHVSDAVGGLLLGAGCLAIALLAARRADPARPEPG
jgi:membrane-associated phospholipid phosphatase